MKSSSEFTGIDVRSQNKKWFQKSSVWIVISMAILVLGIVLLTTVLLVKKMSEKSRVFLQDNPEWSCIRLDNATHIHYTRISTTVHPGGFEMYRLRVLNNRNPAQQYKLLANFIRVSLFNKSSYESLLPNCPIILAMTSAEHPEDWHAMLFATLKFPRANMPYPYVCFLSVLPKDRSYRLGTILLNQFLNDMVIISDWQTRDLCTAVRFRAEKANRSLMYNCTPTGKTVERKLCIADVGFGAMNSRRTVTNHHLNPSINLVTWYEWNLIWPLFVSAALFASTLLRWKFLPGMRTPSLNSATRINRRTSMNRVTKPRRTKRSCFSDKEMSRIRVGHRKRSASIRLHSSYIVLTWWGKSIKINRVSLDEFNQENWGQSDSHQRKTFD